MGSKCKFCEEAKSLAERIYALRVSLSYTEGVAQIAALLDRTSVQSAPSEDGRAIDREDIVSAMTRAFDSKRMPNRSELHEAAVNLANLFQSAVPAPEASEECSLQVLRDDLGILMRNGDEQQRRIVQNAIECVDEIATRPAPTAEKALREAIDSAAAALDSCSTDYSSDPHQAWVYGVLVGWGEALGEVAEKHHWNKPTVKRLRLLRSAIAALDGKEEP